MKEKNENKLDQLFKAGISGSEDHIAFREEDWESMEQLLDSKPGKKAGVFRIIYYASGLAALLLLALGLYFYTNKDTTDPSITRVHNKPVEIQPKQDTARPAQQVQVPTIALPGQQESLSGTNAQSKKTVPLMLQSKPGKQSSPMLQSQGGTIPFAGLTVKNTPYNDEQNLAGNKIMPSKELQKDDVAGTDTLDKNKIGPVNSQTQNNIAAVAITDTPLNTAAEQKARIEMAAIKKSAGNFRPQFSISVLAASDANAVNSFGRSQTGTNYGLQFSIRLTKKLTVTTGVAYAIKPYSTNAGSYSATAYNSTLMPSNIQANCKVLDVPLNISYQVFSKGNNAIALGTGFSSYFMLKENYRFDYAANSGWKPYNLQVNNQNNHLFGVVNIDVNYQRRLNSKFSAVIQPYMKLPITGIGNGRVDLKSTGVALGVNWNIGSALRAK